MRLSRRLLIMLGLLAALVLVAACGGKTSPVFLAPTPQMTASDIGGQQPVMVSVSDMRGTPAVGSRKPLLGDAEDISAMPAVEEVLRTQIRRGLTVKGFNPLDQLPGATRRLEVMLEQFSYTTESSVVSSKVIAHTAMTVNAHVNGRTFTHSYTSRSEETVALGPSEATRERAVNAALTELLDKFMADDTLFRALAGE